MKYVSLCSFPIFGFCVIADTAQINLSVPPDGRHPLALVFADVRQSHFDRGESRRCLTRMCEWRENLRRRLSRVENSFADQSTIVRLLPEIKQNGRVAPKLS